MLPSQILEKATTHDLQIFSIANNIKEREIKKARGENITDTYNKHELEEMYQNFKQREVNVAKKTLR